jgi:hypothetical protein
VLRCREGDLFLDRPPGHRHVLTTVDPLREMITQFATFPAREPVRG